MNIWGIKCTRRVMLRRGPKKENLAYVRISWQWRIPFPKSFLRRAATIMIIHLNNQLLDLMQIQLRYGSNEV